mmetsp:Transcript_42289/g.69717  ORF Transcript_42289/g.69717 Transcript_42289/m.69717 type:complete len:266 (-) Transcript_42289:96-893(-)
MSTSISIPSKISISSSSSSSSSGMNSAVKSMADDEKSNPASQSHKNSSNNRRRHRNRGQGNAKSRQRNRHQQQQGKQQRASNASETSKTCGGGEAFDGNDDEVDLDAQSGCIRIITRWTRRRVNTDGKTDLSDDCGSPEEQRIIEVLIQRLYNTVFKATRYCHDPHILANAPLLLKQFIIFAKRKETQKPALKKLIRKHSKNKLKDLMALFSHQNVSVIQNAVTCMAQLAAFDETLRDEIREMGGLKAMSQLHMQHRETLFKMIK